MKKAEHEIGGNNDVSEQVEMAGWVVEEGEKANGRSDASTYSCLLTPTRNSDSK